MSVENYEVLRNMGEVGHDGKAAQLLEVRTSTGGIFLLIRTYDVRTQEILNKIFIEWELAKELVSRLSEMVEV